MAHGAKHAQLEETLSLVALRVTNNCRLSALFKCPAQGPGGEGKQSELLSLISLNSESIDQTSQI